MRSRFFSVSPMYLSTTVARSIAYRSRPSSPATTSAAIVLPVPGLAGEQRGDAPAARHAGRRIPHSSRTRLAVTRPGPAISRSWRTTRSGSTRSSQPDAAAGCAARAARARRRSARGPRPARSAGSSGLAAERRGQARGAARRDRPARAPSRNGAVAAAASRSGGSSSPSASRHISARRVVPGQRELDDQRDAPAPAGIPRLRTGEDDGPAASARAGGAQPGRAREPLDGPDDEPGVPEARLAQRASVSASTGRRRRAARDRARRHRTPGLRDRGAGERTPGRARALAHVDERRAGSERAGQRRPGRRCRHGMDGRRAAARAPGRRGRRRAGASATRSGTRSDRVRNGRSASSTQDEPAGDERRPAVSRWRRRRRSSRARRRSSSASPTLARRRDDVVVEVAVEPLEPGVEVGGERDEQQLDVDRLELEGSQARRRQPQVGAGGLGGVRLRLDPAQHASRDRRRQAARRAGEQAVDLLVRDVEAAERIVGVGSTTPPAPRGRLDGQAPSSASSTSCAQPSAAVRGWRSDASGGSRARPSGLLGGRLRRRRLRAGSSAGALGRLPVARSAAPCADTTPLRASSTGGPAASTRPRRTAR